jgi:hypothetical protein
MTLETENLKSVLRPDEFSQFSGGDNPFKKVISYKIHILFLMFSHF